MDIRTRIIVQDNSSALRGKYLLYWIQQAQRVYGNPALAYACERAEALSLPLVAIFVLCPDIPDANLRHYTFMWQGLQEMAADLASMGIEFYMASGSPAEMVAAMAKDAVEVIADHGYLHYQRQWRSDLRARLQEQGVAYTEIETEPLVPVALVSDHEEYAAATIRKKLLRKINHDSLLSIATQHHFPKLKQELDSDGAVYRYQPEKPELADIWWQQQLSTDHGVQPAESTRGGHHEAIRLLNHFLKDKLPLYATHRNEPSLDIQSGLSPYLHFGQIGTMEIIQRLLAYLDLDISFLPELIMNRADSNPILAGAGAFAEELVIRRELSFNFCFYNEHYHNFSCLPAWAKSALLNHLSDTRERHYLLDRLEQGSTNDVYWNAAQWEIVNTGKMHNYMRMYWGKQVLAWCDNPEDAYQILVYLNNRYALDGRDPNSYAGIAWCFGKHDRPWQNRPIYGTVRYMNSRGLERKFNMPGYLDRIGYRQ